MTHVATAPHECRGNLIFCEEGLSPYWALGKLLIRGFDGHGEIELEIDGELWTISLGYQKGGIAPRSQDAVDGDRLYEYRISARGRGERKIDFLIQPRFENMQHHETGDSISSPFNHIDTAEAVNVRFSCSNIEPDRFRELLPTFTRALSEHGDVLINSSYFLGRVHEMSNITTYERYLRIHRAKSPKLIDQTGIMRRLLHLFAGERGSKFEYKVDNEDIVGKNHRAVLPKQDAKQLISGHKFGKQIKHYHPKHVRSKDKEDPLYHPKLGVLLKKSLSGHSFDWHDRRAIRQEIDETLINLLHWAGIPTQADQTTFIPDDHFDARPADESVPFVEDPTPEMEAKQEALLVTTLRDMCDSDVEVLETLVEGGEGQHPQQLADATDHGISTIYRALERMKGIVTNDSASVSFTSRKFAQEVSEIVESMETRIESSADRVASILNMEVRNAESTAWQEWLHKYAAQVDGDVESGEMTIRIDTVLSRLKSGSAPRLEDVLQEGLEAWHESSRDPLAFRNARLKWRSGDSWRKGLVGATLR